MGDNQAWYHQHGQKLMAAEAVGSGEDLQPSFCYTDEMSNCLLDTYVYAHILVLSSTWITEASFHSG